MTKGSSRIPSFYKLSVSQRIQALKEHGLVGDEDFQSLSAGRQILSSDKADRMIENVIGVMALPVGLALNFLINGRDRLIPMVVEEPSIVAGLSSAAKLARPTGGFEVDYSGPLLTGQIQLVGLPDVNRARRELLNSRQAIMQLADSLNSRMVARGGGIRDIEVRQLDTPEGSMLILHLLIDTRDAMGANMVNTTCEGVSPLVEKISGGRALLRILSNLTDRSLVRASMRVRPEDLAGKGFDGTQVRDNIVLASSFAAADPYRAATHNKGIMNGVDAVAIAVGNDWRAIEAAAHAYAAKSGRYSSLSSFSVGEDGCLLGTLEMPMKVGTVAGNLETNPAVALNMRLLDVSSAGELAGIMGCVGLAQNFAALRALATEGIQRGHMSLHARTVVTTAEVPAKDFDAVLHRLIASGTIKVWKAKEILAEIRAERAGQPEQSDQSERAGQSNQSEQSEQADQSEQPRQPKSSKSSTAQAFGQAGGKVILLGEHAVVYNRQALAAPLPLAVSATVCDSHQQGIQVNAPQWRIDRRVAHDEASPDGLARLILFLLQHLELSGRNLSLRVEANIPLGTGLGASAALAVAVIRALSNLEGFELTSEQVNSLAYECERLAHGTPSGVDNTLSTYGRFVVFQNQPQGNSIVEIEPARPLPVVIAQTGIKGSTAEAIQRIRLAWQNNKKRYESVFDHIEGLTRSAVQAVKAGDLKELGELMNLCQGDLNALQVSSARIETLVSLARQAGALGAKLTGGGIGGSIVALCEPDTTAVAEAIRAAGYSAMEFSLE